MTQERQQNIELLRIVSMLFVILFHINLNVILRNPETSNFLNYFAIGGNALFAVAVNCFVLISGYFGIHYKMRSFLGLFFQTEFYSVVVLIAAILLIGYQFTIPSGLLPFHPSGLWFIPVYVLLYILSPILNQLVQSKILHKFAMASVIILSLSAYFMGGV